MADLLTWLWRARERVLHPLRRRRALARLAARRRPGGVLVMCNGNIFRSPFAAALLRRSLGPEGVEVTSAGLMGAGRRSPPNAIAAAAARGVDLTAHRSQVVTAELVRAAELIVVMDGLQRRVVCGHFGRSPRDVLMLGDLDPEPIVTRDIADPVEQAPEVCGTVYARIERCVGALTSTLRSLPVGRAT